MDELIDSKQPAKYDEAVKLLVDLRDLNKKTGKDKAFKQKLKTICENHHRKVSFLNRLQKGNLTGWLSNARSWKTFPVKISEAWEYAIDILP